HPVATREPTQPLFAGLHRFLGESYEPLRSLLRTASIVRSDKASATKGHEMKPALPTRLRWRMVAAVTAATVIAGTVTGIALARSSAPRIGNGVVVIETALGYQGGAAAGTGMVLTPSGEILTNNHVIRGATTIRIVIPGTSRSYRAKVVGYDVADDVAVVQAVGASNLRTITTASKVSVGDAVTAVGNAGGTGALTSAPGSVTGLAQAITVSDDQGGAARLTGLIET